MGVDGYISIGKERLHYLKWGSGPKLLLGFHGYGNDAAIFSPLAPYLDKAYTFLSFDLPHHGGSSWGAEPVTKNDLVELVKATMIEYTTGKVSLLGYSLGGRVCLALIEQIPQFVEKAVLLASDGLTVDYFYQFLTGTRVGSMMFRNMIEKPDRYIGVANWLQQKKLLHESRHKFVMKYIRTPEAREFLGRVWPGMRYVQPNLPHVKAAIDKYNIPVTLVMGVNDKIITPSGAHRFKGNLRPVKVILAQRGHRVFDAENAEEIAGYLQPTL